MRGYLSEGRSCLLRLLGFEEAGAFPRARAAALDALGRLALAQDDHVGATHALQASAGLFLTLGDPGRAAWSLSSLAISAFRQRDQAQAVQLAAHASALAQESEDELAIGRCGAAEALAAWGRGDTAAAALLLANSLALGRRWQCDWVVAKMLHFIGWFAYPDGDTSRGLALERESVSILRSLGDRRLLADCLDVLACLCRERDDPTDVAANLALADRLREDIGCPRPAYLQESCAAARAYTHTRLASGALAVARTTGARWDLDRIAAHVLTPQIAPSGTAAATKSDVRSQPGPLTAREHQVAELLTQGFTNGEIAAALTISERTAERHLENLRRKLGVRSRAQVAAWVAAPRTCATRRWVALWREVRKRARGWPWCTSFPDEAPRRAHMDYNDKLEDAWLDALNAHDVDSVEACFTDDAVFTDIVTGQVARGRDELRRSVEGLFATFGDLCIERTSAVTDGTTLAHEFTMSGVHSGSVPGLEATGKSFSTSGAIVCQLRDGKFSRATEYWNMADVLTQVGVLHASS